MNRSGEEHENFLESIRQGKTSKGPWYLERLFTNLKVLSRLKEGQKLYVNNEVLAIEDSEKSDVVKSVIRWWFKESREETLKKVQVIIQNAIDCGRKAIESNILSEDASTGSKLSKEELRRRVMIREWEEIRDRELRMGNNKLLEKLNDQLSNVIVGIRELEKTYGDDMQLRSKLELEIELIERTKGEFEKYLSSIETRGHNNYGRDMV